ncbi:hypothetical protein LSAT2_020452, partial [Lamellibrachia satsuma]
LSLAACDTPAEATPSRGGLPARPSHSAAIDRRMVESTTYAVLSLVGSGVTASHLLLALNAPSLLLAGESRVD